MAINPMQKKARNSFILGMLATFVFAIMGIGIFVITQFIPLQQENNKLKTSSQEMYMLKKPVQSGQLISLSDLEKVIVSANTSTKMNSSIVTKGSDIKEDTMAKIALNPGTFLTNDMLMESEEKDENFRIQEYNMILLPSDLTKDNYIDIRLRLANGQDYIVLSKKKVLKSKQNTIFLQLNEQEILTMSNAIVESYISTGSLIYADKYTDAAIQTASTPTYNVSKAVVGLITDNPNITDEARNNLWKRYKTERRAEVDTILSTAEDATESVETGVSEQIQKQEAERTKYIEELGTDDY